MSFNAPLIHRQGASKCPDFRRFRGRNPHPVEYLATINTPRVSRGRRRVAVVLPRGYPPTARQARRYSGRRTRIWSTPMRPSRNVSMAPTRYSRQHAGHFLAHHRDGARPSSSSNRSVPGLDGAHVVLAHAPRTPRISKPAVLKQADASPPPDACACPGAMKDSMNGPAARVLAVPGHLLDQHPAAGPHVAEQGGGVDSGSCAGLRARPFPGRRRRRTGPSVTSR